MENAATSQPHRHSLKRSRSPSRAERDAKHVKHRRHSHRESSPKKDLPFGSPQLHKHDFPRYTALLADYLMRKKDLDIRVLDEEEVKGRWKSFLGKWNRGELDKRWYDPVTKRLCDDEIDSQGRVRSSKPDHRRPSSEDEDEEDEHETYGPTLPSSTARKGPTIPNTQDLLLKSEQAREDHAAHRASLRHERKAEQKAAQTRLDELAPRAEAGSRERQLEKKREVAASNRAFAEAKEGGGAEEVGEAELLGADGGVEGFKARVKEKERARNEREVRKEELLRARAVEREEKLKGRRRKEEETMEMLRGLARARFGDGVGDGVGGGDGG